MISAPPCICSLFAFISILFASFTSAPQTVSAQPASPTTQATRLTEKELAGVLAAEMKAVADKDEFSGVVLVARNGRPIYSQAFGMASKSFEVRNRLDTQFNLASVGKMFTAVAVLQLVQAGKLSLEDPASKYVPEEWLAPEYGSKIKIKHLLTHTSGFGTYFENLNKQSDVVFFRDLADYKKLIRSEVPSFEPGTKWNYSNTGMVLLGIIVEKVSGQEYFDYLDQNIFAPAGMTKTVALDKDSAVPGRSTGYARVKVGRTTVWRENSVSRVLKGNPSGGIYSTADDLLRFDQALRSHRLLSPELTEVALSPKPELNSPFYGYGFFVASDKELGRQAGHSGDGTGINCQFKMYLDKGYTVAVLSNYGAPSANSVEKIIQGLIAQAK